MKTFHFILLLLFLACTGAEEEVQPQNPLDKFLGIYQVEETWIQYTNTYGREDTTYGESRYQLTIKINTFEEDGQSVLFEGITGQATVDENNKNQLNLSDIAGTDFWGSGPGTFILEGDSLFMDYESYRYFSGSNSSATKYIQGKGFKIAEEDLD